MEWLRFKHSNDEKCWGKKKHLFIALVGVQTAAAIISVWRFLKELKNIYHKTLYILIAYSMVF